MALLIPKVAERLEAFESSRQSDLASYTAGDDRADGRDGVSL